MANRVKVTPRSHSVQSGQSIDLVVEYRSESDGALTISPSAGFTVSPDEVALAAAASGDISFSLTISREDGSGQLCRLGFEFPDTDRIQAEWIYVT